MNKESFRYKHYLRVITRLSKSQILPLFNFENYIGTNGRYNLKCGICNFEFVASFNCGHTPHCPKCYPNRLTVNYGHSEKVDIQCKNCHNIFSVIWKNRNHRFCSVKCKCEFIKHEKRETVKCLNCGNLFERYKYILHPDTGLPTQYCSNECNRTSQEKKHKLRMWMMSNNPMNTSSSVGKIAQTKLDRYGDSRYNNMPKNTEARA